MNRDLASLPCWRSLTVLPIRGQGLISEYPGLPRIANTSPRQSCRYAVLSLLISIYRYSFVADTGAVECGLRSEHDCALRLSWQLVSLR